MKGVFLALALAAAGAAQAQRVTIKVEEAGQHVGDSVQFCATVKTSRYFVQVTGKPTILYFGNPYPNHQLSVVIWERDRKNFPKPVELLYNSGEVCVTGKVVLVDGKPQVEVRSPGQIGFPEDGD